MHRAVLVVVVLAGREILLAEMEQQTQVAVVVARAILRVLVKLVAQVVQALSFFATPAQFNISLVAQ
jgi:hypothetical protein